MGLQVSVGERSVTYRILGDLSGLPPSAFDSSAMLQGADTTLEFFDSRGPIAIAVLTARLVAGGHREIDLVASPGDTVSAMRRIATRLEERLPDWPSPDEAFSGLCLIEPGFFYGRVGNRGYRTVTPLVGDDERHAEEALLLVLEMAHRHDPRRTVRFHRSSRRDRDLVIDPSKPPATYLRGAAGRMRVAPEYTPAACQQVVCVDDAEVSAHLRFSGPSYAFVARGPKARAVELACEAVSIHQGREAPHPEVRETAALLGLAR